jgi:hypothetical protein
MITVTQEYKDELLNRCESLMTGIYTDSERIENKLDNVDAIVALYKEFLTIAPEKKSYTETVSALNRTIMSLLTEASRTKYMVPVYGNIFIQDLAKTLTTDFKFNPMNYLNVDLDAPSATRVMFVLEGKYTLPATLADELYVMFNKLSVLQMVFIIKILITMFGYVKS